MIFSRIRTTIKCLDILFCILCLYASCATNSLSYPPGKMVEMNKTNIDRFEIELKKLIRNSRLKIFNSGKLWECGHAPSLCDDSK